MEQRLNGLGAWETDIEAGLVKTEALVRAVLLENDLDFDHVVAITEVALRRGILQVGGDSDIPVPQLVVNDVLGMLRAGKLNLDFLMPRSSKNNCCARPGEFGLRKKRKDIRLADRDRNLRFGALFSSMKGGRVLRNGKKGGFAAARLENLLEARVTPDAL